MRKRTDTALAEAGGAGLPGDGGAGTRGSGTSKARAGHEGASPMRAGGRSHTAKNAGQGTADAARTRPDQGAAMAREGARLGTGAESEATNEALTLAGVDAIGGAGTREGRAPARVASAGTRDGAGSETQADERSAAGGDDRGAGSATGGARSGGHSGSADDGNAGAAADLGSRSGGIAAASAPTESPNGAIGGDRPGGDAGTGEETDGGQTGGTLAIEGEGLGTGAESEATNEATLSMRDAALQARERDVLRRELALRAQDALQKSELPLELLSALPLTDEAALDAALPRVEAAFRAAVAAEMKRKLAGTAPVLGGEGAPAGGALRRAFGLD